MVNQENGIKLLLDQAKDKAGGRRPRSFRGAGSHFLTNTSLINGNYFPYLRKPGGEEW